MAQLKDSLAETVNSPLRSPFVLFRSSESWMPAYNGKGDPPYSVY